MQQWRFPVTFTDLGTGRHTSPIMDTSLWGLVSGPLAYLVPLTADFEVEASCFEVRGWANVDA